MLDLVKIISNKKEFKINFVIDMTIQYFSIYMTVIELYSNIFSYPSVNSQNLYGNF